MGVLQPTEGPDVTCCAPRLVEDGGRTAGIRVTLDESCRRGQRALQATNQNFKSSTLCGQGGQTLHGCGEEPPHGSARSAMQETSGMWLRAGRGKYRELAAIVSRGGDKVLGHESPHAAAVPGRWKVFCDDGPHVLQIALR